MQIMTSHFNGNTTEMLPSYNDLNMTNISCINGSRAEETSMPSSSQWGFWVKFISTPIIVNAGIAGNCLSLVTPQNCRKDQSDIRLKVLKWVVKKLKKQKDAFGQ
ncbi:hypothetical protein ACF0H5_017769 [Mactra antiquata]